MSNPQLRGQISDRAPRAFRLALFSILIAGAGAVALLGGNLALLAFEPTTTVKAPADVRPVPDTKLANAPEIHRPKGTLLICGGAEFMAVLAANFDGFAEDGVRGEHAHIEYFPDHCYLAKDADPLVLALA